MHCVLFKINFRFHGKQQYKNNIQIKVETWTLGGSFTGTDERREVYKRSGRENVPLFLLFDDKWGYLLNLPSGSFLEMVGWRVKNACRGVKLSLWRSSDPFLVNYHAVASSSFLLKLWAVFGGKLLVDLTHQEAHHFTLADTVLGFIFSVTFISLHFLYLFM